MTYQHHPQCPFPTHSDAAKRLYDAYNLHYVAGGSTVYGKFIATRLVDGESRPTLYDTKADAVRDLKHYEMFYMFTQIRPHTLNLCDAEIWMKVNRDIQASGLRLTDPDHARGGRDPIRRASREDMRSFAHTRRMPNLIIPGRMN